MSESETIIKIGKYRFKISENILQYGGNIFSHTFKIGGSYNDCVNLSYSYNNGNPISAKLPHLMYEPECSIDSDLERGIGSELLIKTLLRYAYKKIKNVNIFYFDDMSHIDCMEKNLSKSPPRKPQRPLKLSYFSIAYNDMTWYEKHFNAKMSDKDKYNNYLTKIQFLKDNKSKETFERFLEITTPPIEQIAQLKEYYEPAETYRDFFNNIPYKERCSILLPWLSNFMNYYLKDVYSDNGWEIDINTMDNKRGGIYKNRKKIHNNTRKLYTKSKYKIINYTEIHNI
jgi:hypothetical protein